VWCQLHILGHLLGVDGSATRRALRLGKLIIALRAMQILLKDGLGFVEFELGLEAVKVCREAAAVGAATSIGKVEWLINHLLTGIAPVASAAAILLGLLGVGVSEAVLSKELRQVLLREDGALGNAGVVLVVVLVRTSHLDDEIW